MTKVIILKRRNLWMGGIACLVVIAGGLFFWLKHSWAVPASSGNEGIRTISMATTEVKSTANGKTSETYRFDPGTVFVDKNERVNLVFKGVNGESHPFYIEGTTIKGDVKKGKETAVIFQPDKEGVYRIICQTHTDKNHEGPMIGYIIVK